MKPRNLENTLHWCLSSWRRSHTLALLPHVCAFLSLESLAQGALPYSDSLSSPEISFSKILPFDVPKSRSHISLGCHSGLC